MNFQTSAWLHQKPNLVGCLFPFSFPSGTGAPLGLASSAEARAEGHRFGLSSVCRCFFAMYKLRSLIQLAVPIHHNLTTGERMQVISWDIKR